MENELGLLAQDFEAPQAAGDWWVRRASSTAQARAALLDLGIPHEAFTKPANDLARFA